MSASLLINFVSLKTKINSEFLIKASWILFMISWVVIQIWANRFFEHYSDGISYLDMADAWMHGDWLGGFSSYWNPLYPLIIMIVFSVLRPSSLDEFAALKLVNCLI